MPKKQNLSFCTLLTFGEPNMLRFLITLEASRILLTFSFSIHKMDLNSSVSKNFFHKIFEYLWRSSQKVFEKCIGLTLEKFLVKNFSQTKSTGNHSNFTSLFSFESYSKMVRFNDSLLTDCAVNENV